jgi:hypothetical protein
MLSTTTVTHMLQYRILYYHVGLRGPELDAEQHYRHTYAALQMILSSHGPLKLEMEMDTTTVTHVLK